MKQGKLPIPTDTVLVDNEPLQFITITELGSKYSLASEDIGNLHCYTIYSKSNSLLLLFL